MGLLRRPTPGEMMEGGRLGRPCGPGALRTQSQETSLRLRRPSRIATRRFLPRSDLGPRPACGSSAAVSVRAWLGDLPPLAGLWVTARRRSGPGRAGRRSGPCVLKAERQALTRPARAFPVLAPARVPAPAATAFRVSRPSGSGCRRVAADAQAHHGHRPGAGPGSGPGGRRRAIPAGAGGERRQCGAGLEPAAAEHLQGDQDRPHHRRPSLGRGPYRHL
jgi:hypothetical protein